MKRFFGLMLLYATMVSFVSCEKVNYSVNQIIGTWETTHYKVDGEWIRIPSYSTLNATMTFYDDGRYYGKSDIFGTGWAKYKLRGNTIITYIETYIDEELLYIYYIRELTYFSTKVKYAEVTMADGESTIDFKLSKI